MEKLTLRTAVLFCCLFSHSLFIAQTSSHSPCSALSHRWYRNLYSVGNAYWAQTSAGLTAAKSLADTAAKHGFNGVVLPMHLYFMSWNQTAKNNFQSYITYCKNLGLEVIPEVFPINAAGTVFNRNFAEADPDTITLIAGADSLRPVLANTNHVLNGGLENNSGNTFNQYLFNDKPGTCTFTDNIEKSQGNSSIRFENFTANNGMVRLSQNIILRPNHHYRFKFMLKKSTYPGKVAVNIYGKNFMNQIQMFNTPAAQPNIPWTQYSFEFSTSDSPDINFYIGTWSGSGSGQFWIDDVEIVESSSLSDIVRRDGTPITVKSTNGRITYREGIDFDLISNLKVLPSIAVKAGSRIVKNQQVVLSCYKIADFDGKSALCMTHDSIYYYFSNMMQSMYSLYHFKKVFLYIDEIRTAGSCLKCKNSGKSTAQLLGNCTKRLYDMLRIIDPTMEVITWGDMFDPNFNAKNHYYKVVGDLTGSWNYIPKDITIVPWGDPDSIGSNKYTSLKSSMDHFVSNRFNNLIGAGYYDTGNLIGTSSWINLLSNYKQSKGLIYTTWGVDDFSKLGSFGDLMMDSISATPTINSSGYVLTSSAASGNQWYLNGAPISGATGKTYNVTTNGIYTVVATVSGCPSATSLPLTISIIPPSTPNTYFISSSSGNNTNNGTSPQTPWKTISKVSNTTFLPGDIILFKRGDVWKEGVTLSFTESGTANNPIVISAYGTGNKPVISDILPLKGWEASSNWISASNNIWKMKCKSTPNRLWLNNIEVLTAVTLVDVGKINSQGTFEWWYYSSTDSLLYLYATSNPATKYISIEGNNPSSVFALYGNSYLKVDGLDFRGGRWSTIYLGAASYSTIKNCNIGFGLTGIFATSSNSIASTHHMIIENNTFDSGHNFLYGKSSTGTDGYSRGSEDGITMSFAVNNCIIRNNTFTGWGHAAINGYCKNIAYSGIHDNKIYSNYFTGTNNSYNRAIGLDGFEGKSYNNEIYYNLMKDHKVRNQINGNNNWVHHNIFDGQTTSPARNFSTDGAGQAIEMSVYGLGLVSHDNKIDNNIFINTTEAAIVLRSYGGFSDKSANHLIRNNIFYNTGYKTALAADSGVAIKLTTTVETFNNTFQNNCIYNPGKPLTSAIKYYGTLMSVSQFNNSPIGNSGNTISDNIQMDPLFVDYINHNFHLRSNSPCIDSGIVIAGLKNDLDGNQIYFGATSDIGPYEFISGVGITDYLPNKEEFLIYPNPFISSFQINTEDAGEKTIEIYNSLGNLILTKTSNDKTIEIDLSNQACGIYFIKTCNMNNKTITARVIKQ